jgi:exodeoxyribonuclease-5
MDFELNNQQKLATNESEKWFRSGIKQIFEISGPAGSGKTTIVYYLIQKLGLNPKDVLFMAYVGKATMALARKGNLAHTIHSTIYKLVEVPKLDEDGNTIKKHNRIVTIPTFIKREELPPNIKLLVIDEGSMVNKQIAEDILSFGLPILVLGDLNQLPPVFGESYFLVNPDVILTEIMRQKENDPIIWLSQQAIKGKSLRIGKYGPKCFIIDKENITDNMLTKSDIVICGKNKTRESINTYVRESIYGINKPFPTKGEKLICRRNNWRESINNDIFLINGLIGYVEDVYLDTYNKSSLCIDFRPEFLETDKFEKIAIDYKYLFASPEQKKIGERGYYNKFEFANAITCHLAQGSQYPKVFIYDEKIGDKFYYRKWLYTAITRAIDGLIIAV